MLPIPIWEVNPAIMSCGHICYIIPIASQMGSLFAATHLCIFGDYGGETEDE